MSSAVGMAEKILAGCSRRDATATFTVATCGGSGGVGRCLEQAAAAEGRPVVYLNLRAATSPHDLLFAFISSVYSAERLGFLGTIAHSMGVWWLMLLDILFAHHPDQSRALNLSVLLQHLSRALRLAWASDPADGVRPLVIVDHFGESTSHARAQGTDPGGSKLWAMLVHLAAWLEGVCFDDSLADVVICSESLETTWRSSSVGKIGKITNTGELHEYLGTMIKARVPMKQR